MHSVSRPTRPPGTDSAVAIRRFVNDEIAHIAKRLDPDDRYEYEFICECGDLECERRANLTVAEYQGLLPGSVVGHPVLAA